MTESLIGYINELTGKFYNITADSLVDIRHTIDHGKDHHKIQGDLLVDSPTFHIDTVNNRVGIGTITPADKLEVVGAVRTGEILIESLSGHPLIVYKKVENENDLVQLKDHTGSTVAKFNHLGELTTKGLYIYPDTDGHQAVIHMKESDITDNLQVRDHTNTTMMAIDYRGFVYCDSLYSFSHQTSRLAFNSTKIELRPNDVLVWDSNGIGINEYTFTSKVISAPALYGFIQLKQTHASNLNFMYLSCKDKDNNDLINLEGTGEIFCKLMNIETIATSVAHPLSIKQNNAETTSDLVQVKNSVNTAICGIDHTGSFYGKGLTISGDQGLSIEPTAAGHHFVINRYGSSTSDIMLYQDNNVVKMSIDYQGNMFSDKYLGYANQSTSMSINANDITFNKNIKIDEGGTHKIEFSPESHLGRTKQGYSHTHIVNYDFTIGDIEDYEGKLVSSNGSISVLDDEGNVGTAINSISLTNALPIVSMTSGANDKKVLGVILQKFTDADDNFPVHQGMTKHNYPKPETHKLIEIISAGDCGMWIVSLKAIDEEYDYDDSVVVIGDFICSSEIAGIGHLQESNNDRKNYTIGKILIDVDWSNPPSNIESQVIDYDEQDYTAYFVPVHLSI